MSKAQTVRTGKLGKKGWSFLGLSGGVLCVEGDNADKVWLQLHDDAGKGDPKYFGFDGARARFLRFFPNGFHSDGYVAEERNYKVAAKAKLDETVPLEKAIDGVGYGEAALTVFRATNMLSPFEKTRLQDVQRGPNANDFIRGAARFAKDGGKTNLLSMAQALKPQDSDKWTVVSYLPYLWRPDMHMFLKPEATKDFATATDVVSANEGYGTFVLHR